MPQPHIPAPLQVDFVDGTEIVTLITFCFFVPGLAGGAYFNSANFLDAISQPIDWREYFALAPPWKYQRSQELLFGYLSATKGYTYLPWSEHYQYYSASWDIFTYVCRNSEIVLFDPAAVHKDKSWYGVPLAREVQHSAPCLPGRHCSEKKSVSMDGAPLKYIGGFMSLLVCGPCAWRRAFRYFKFLKDWCNTCRWRTPCPVCVRRKHG